MATWTWFLKGTKVNGLSAICGHIERNKLYGRGATDMKSGLVAMVLAMIELKEKEVPLNGAVKFLGTVGEEVGELGAGQLTEKGYADDLSALVIGEPTNYNLMYAHMGSINYSVVSHGKEAHSSMPEEGINAINNLNEFITEANQQMAEVTANYENPELGRTIHNVTVIKGGTSEQYSRSSDLKGISVQFQNSATTKSLHYYKNCR